DGTTRIVSIWDQTIQEGQPPTDLVFGTEYSRDQINTALKSGNPSEIVPSKDDVGHGTFLAGIAAGNEDSYNSFSGVATDSELVIVKLKQTKQNLRELYRVPKDAICFQENDIMLGIKYLLSVAQNLGRPLSICIGLGTSQGGHDGRGALGLYLSIINNMEGIAVSVAAGNEGNTRRHYEGFLITGVDKETVELNVGPKEPGFGMEIWSDIPSTFSIELYSPTGEYVPIITPRLGERRTVRFFFNSTTIEIYFQLLGSRSGSQLVILFFDHPGAGIWRMVINKISRNIDLRYHIWLPMRNFLNEKTYFINSSPFTTLTSPADSNALIVATAYNSLNDSIAPEASRGYTRYGEIVPHFAAPGVGLIGPGQANSYSVRSGTSIAAAHTAGVAAMLLEWGIIKGHLRSMNGIDIKNMLLLGADRDIGGPYPNREWGYGLLDVYGAFERLSGQ
ncbi:MAG TPA: S8 family peptidase, partial [Mobilitalea sp.]|nr:S8 family peptidase [Mobilitalea sp.]